MTASLVHNFGISGVVFVRGARDSPSLVLLIPTGFKFTILAEEALLPLLVNFPVYYPVYHRKK
jgi:hypothetical protein